MSLTQLEYFVAIAEVGTVRGAAARLHISQPPLTRHLKALEDELGTPLFHRTTKGVTLLPQGEVLLGHAREILAAVRRAAAVVSASAPPGDHSE